MATEATQTEEAPQPATTPEPAPARHRAIVTGASSGIGAEFARQLARKCYDVVIVARRRGRLEELANELAERGAAAEVIEADLSRPEGVGAVVERLSKGDISFLVNNAGFGSRGHFVALPLERELEEIDLNVRALTQLSHTALGPMKAKRAGTIINVASTGAYQPVPYMSTYAATKAYVLSFSEGLHEEAKAYGVTVTCLCPGYVMTEFQQVAGLDRAKMPDRGRLTPAQVVAAALKGASEGRAIVIPGTMNRALVTGLVRVTPRFAVRRIAGNLFKDAGSS